METITLTIDGNTISARAGATILDVARRHGIFIPTLCHHEALRPIGACRLCQVEDEKRNMVVPACVTKIQQGMVIATSSPRVVRNRRNIVRMLMAAHPESCVVCEKGNRCELRNLAAQLGVGHHGLDPMPYHPRVEDLNPFMTRDLSKCIMCAKCVRADQEVVCEGVIDYNHRGFDARPSTLFERPLEQAQCTFCGSCLTVCPTGAIAEKEKYRLDHAGARTRSVCSFCACGCAIHLEHDYNHVLGVSPSAKTHTANGISLCVKGHFGHDYINSPDRLTSPMVKSDGGFRPVSWDEALNLITEKFGEIADGHGPGALGFMGSARATNEEVYLFQKLARAVYGTNNVDHAGRAWWAGAYGVLRESTGFSAGSSPFKEVEASDAILVIGADPTRTAPVLGYHIKRAARREGRKLIVVDPVRTKLASRADLWLRPSPATDFHLLRGMLRVILLEGLTDLEFVTTKTRMHDVLRVFLEPVSVGECAAKCGVPEADIREAARMFAEAESGFVVFGHGVVKQRGGADLVRMLVDLLLATGNLGKNRAGLMPVLKDGNAQGALDMGAAPDWLPGQRLLGNEAARRRIGSLWGGELPAEPGLDAWSMLSAAMGGRLRGLYVFCENPAAVYPDPAAVTEALAGLPFLVVQDMFLTETARLADVVLPSTAWAEKEGTVTNVERRVQRLNRAVQSPGDFPPDWEILLRLAQRRGAAWAYGSVREVLAEIEQATPIYAELSAAPLEDRPVFWPQPGLEGVYDTLPHGIGHMDGKALFLVPTGSDGAGLSGDAEYPLVLMQGQVLQHLGSGARTSRSKRLLRAAPFSGLDVSPADMKALGLEDGDRVRVTSRAGAVEAPVRPDPDLPAGLVFMPGCCADVRPNGLFEKNWASPGEPGDLKHCRVRLEKLS